MDNIQELPLPEELVKKSTTRSISLRVNEETLFTFEKYANLYNTTTSTLINNLLDAYAKRLDTANISKDQSIYLAIRMMDSKLNKKAQKIKFKTREELSTVLSYRYDESYTIKLDCDKSGRECGYSLEEEGLLSIDFVEDKIHFYLGPSREAALNEAMGECSVMVPHSVWPHVAMMLLAYQDGYRELRIEKQAKQDKYLMRDTLADIVERINATIGRPDELVTAMKKLLVRNFEFLLRHGMIRVETM